MIIMLEACIDIMCRTIFDVNIETFERKPWRHPGVDIGDFFNFGLDEESWKDYCNHLVIEVFCRCIFKHFSLDNIYKVAKWGT